MKLNTLLLAGAALVTVASSASAQTVAYTNGPINGSITAYAFAAGSGYAVINSFVLSAPTTITGFTFGGWTDPGNPITTVDYSFSTSDTDFTPIGTASLTNTLVTANAFGYYDVREYTASIAPISFLAGTYYFGLGNAVTSSGDPSYWDENDGPSTAYQTNSQAIIPSESFALLSGAGAVPEPATWAMMVMGFGMVGFGLRRRAKHAVRVTYA